MCDEDEYQSNIEEKHSSVGRLLTIGIPTHNGAAYLRSTLDSILSQDLFETETVVDVLICDNASSDNTQELSNEYARKYPNIITYLRSDVNLGYDKNVDRIFKHAKGDYVELLGDDDYYLARSSLSEIVDKLRKNVDVQLMLLSVVFHDIESDTLYGGNVNGDCNILCDNGDAFFASSIWGASALSSLVINKREWNKYDLTKYYGTQWMHLAGILNILKEPGLSLILTNKTIAVRTGNLRWVKNYGSQLLTGFKHLDVLSELSSPPYKKETFQYFIESRYKNNLHDILLLSPNSFSEKVEVLKQMHRWFKCKYLFWLLHVPAMFLPRFFVQSAIAIRKKLRK